MARGALHIETGSSQGGWRASLRDHVSRLWELGLIRQSGDSGVAVQSIALPAELSEALGDRAEQVGSMLHRLVAGALDEHARNGGDMALYRASLENQIDLMVAGLRERSSRGVPANAQNREGRPQVLQSELWQLLHIIRESGDLAYAREVDLVELDRRILLRINYCGPQSPADMANWAGVDKAQVSRSVKRLLEEGLVERSQIRSPLVLTAKGEKPAGRLQRLARLRNRELTFDIADEEFDRFLSAIDVLLARAMQLYEQERHLANSQGSAEPTFSSDDAVPERRNGEWPGTDRTHIISPLMTLMAYFSRSGGLAFKRTTGLSNFEAWVLSEISYDPPTDWGRLVEQLRRDHSQAARTVNALIERGLAKREGKPGRRHGRFSPTAEGARLYQIIFETAKKRAAFLTAPLMPDRFAEFMETFGKLRRNAEAQLERERAYAELENQ